MHPKEDKQERAEEKPQRNYIPRFQPTNCGRSQELQLRLINRVGVGYGRGGVI
jgi:hypothetical protein